MTTKNRPQLDECHCLCHWRRLGKAIAGDSFLPPSQVEFLVNSLTPLERAVVVYRFGMNNGEVHSLEETGAKLERTRERIRQIEARALVKMRQGIR